MKQPFQSIPGSVTAPTGFQSAGVFCDIKRLGTGKGSNKGKKLDLGVIVSEKPAAVAGLFTTNQVCAAPVKISRERVPGKEAVAIVANSGNANACTGKQGLKNAELMTQLVADRLGVKATQVLVCSTGRIGVLLPMPNVQQGIEAALSNLGSTEGHSHQMAEAIMTSDTRPKEIAVQFKLGKRLIKIGGICKGAGMIQPGMSPTGARPASIPLHATMLGMITTDAAIDSKLLQAALTEAVANSFNCITVDGDMSTNDTVLILANGMAGNPKLKSRSDAGFPLFQNALNHVALELAKMIVRDGEGVTRFITIKLQGARTFQDADAAARAVANSLLVKTSWCGGDPNWGRILDAIGYSRASIVEEKVDVGYSTPHGKKILYALKKGQPTSTPLSELKKIVTQPEFDLHIHLNVGNSSARIYTGDLTEEYVDFNKGE